MSAFKKMNAVRTHTPAKQSDLYHLIFGDTPPFNLAAEAAILGALLVNDKSFGVAKRFVKSPDVFYKMSHQVVWQAMELLYKKSYKIDLITVTDQLLKLKALPTKKDDEIRAKQKTKEKLSTYQQARITKLDNIDLDASDLVELTAKVASDEHLETHCRVVYEMYMRRKSVEIAANVAKNAADLSCDIFDIMGDAAKDFRKTIPSSILQRQTMNESIQSGLKEEKSKWMVKNLFRERDISFVFSDPGTGKTAFLVQAGDAISKGKDLYDNDLFRNECEPKKVLIFDFELENSELAERCSKEEILAIKEEKKVLTAYQFSDNFIRYSIKPDFTDFDKADQLIFAEVQTAIEMEEPEFVIIDNITYLISEAGDNKIAIAFMKSLKAIQLRATNKMSLCIIGHTKKRDKSQPLDQNDLAGASNLANFTKTMLAIGKSKKDPQIRYIKALKTRNSIGVFSEDNVAVFCMDKKDLMLKYEYLGTSKEIEHLVIQDDEDNHDKAIARGVDLRAAGWGWGKIATQLSTEFATSWQRMTVKRKIVKFNNENPQAIKNAIADKELDAIDEADAAKRAKAAEEALKKKE